MSEEKSCRGQNGVFPATVDRETKQIEDDWKRYGNLMVKPAFGSESITELLISYAVGLASLKY